MGSYLVRLQSAFVPSAFLTSRPSRKARAAAFAALSKPRQPNRSKGPFGLGGLRLGLRSHPSPCSIAIRVEHKERRMRE